MDNWIVKTIRKLSGLFRSLSARDITAVRIKAGARAFSKPDGVDWGLIPESLIGIPVIIGSWFSGYGRVDSPVWPKNLKPFWAKETFLEVYTIPDQPPPPQTGPDILYISTQSTLYIVEEDGTLLGIYHPEANTKLIKDVS